MNKCHNTINNGKKNQENEAKENHKDVVNEELGVFVEDIHSFVKNRDGLGARMLMETFLEIKLEKVRAKYIIIIIREIVQNYHRIIFMWYRTYVTFNSID